MYEASLWRKPETNDIKSYLSSAVRARSNKQYSTDVEAALYRLAQKTRISMS